MYNLNGITKMLTTNYCGVSWQLHYGGIVYTCGMIVDMIVCVKVVRQITTEN
jgi:hypothetical protein